MDRQPSSRGKCLSSTPGPPTDTAWSRLTCRVVRRHGLERIGEENTAPVVCHCISINGQAVAPALECGVRDEKTCCPSVVCTPTYRCAPRVLRRPGSFRFLPFHPPPFALFPQLFNFDANLRAGFHSFVPQRQRRVPSADRPGTRSF